MSITFRRLPYTFIQRFQSSPSSSTLTFSHHRRSFVTSASSSTGKAAHDAGAASLPESGRGHAVNARSKPTQQPSDPMKQPTSGSAKVVQPSIDSPTNPNFNDTMHGGRLASQRPFDESQKWYQPITGSAHVGQQPPKYDTEDMIPSQWQIESSTDLIHPYDPITGRPTPMEYVSRVPPIEVDGLIAVCDGGGGHPKEFIQLNKVNPDEPETCKYCGLRYIQSHERRVHTSPHDAAERVDPTNLS